MPEAVARAARGPRAFGERAAYEGLARELPFFRGYTDAFGHALVVAGSMDAMVDVGLNPWDAAATQALVPEAGGRCVTLDRTGDDIVSGLAKPEWLMEIDVIAVIPEEDAT